MSKAVEPKEPESKIIPEGPVSREYASPCGGEKRVELDGSVMAGVLVTNGWTIVEEVVEVQPHTNRPARYLYEVAGFFFLYLKHKLTSCTQEKGYYDLYMQGLNNPSVQGLRDLLRR